MKLKKLLKKLEGLQTIKSISTILNVNRKKAIYYIFRLRKAGYVKTKRLRDKTRVYNISISNKLKSTSYYDILNKYSPIKLAVPKIYKIYGKEPTLEETLIFAIKTRSFRIILASLALFRKIEDWSKLYYLAKINSLKREIGVLYDVAKKTMRVKKMTKRFRNKVLPKERDNFIYLIPELKSQDFRKIEDIWKVYIPFNKEDLEVYR